MVHHRGHAVGGSPHRSDLSTAQLDTLFAVVAPAGSTPTGARQRGPSEPDLAFAGTNVISAPNRAPRG